MSPFCMSFERTMSPALAEVRFKVYQSQLFCQPYHVSQVLGIRAEQKLILTIICCLESGKFQGIAKFGCYCYRNSSFYRVRYRRELQNIVEKWGSPLFVT